MIILLFLRSGMKDFWRWVLGKCSRYNSFIQVWTICLYTKWLWTRGADLCWALWEIICNFTPILPYFQHWGGWTSTTIFVRWANQVKTKKRSSPKMEHFFLRIQMETCAQMHTGVKFLEGMQRKTTLKLLGGYSQIIGGNISPPVSAPLLWTMLVETTLFWTKCYK